MRLWQVKVLVVVLGFAGLVLWAAEPSVPRNANVHDRVELVDANGYAVGVYGAAMAISATYDAAIAAEANYTSKQARIAADDGNAVRKATDYILTGVYRMMVEPNQRIIRDPNVCALAAWPAATVRFGIVAEASDSNIRFAREAAATGTTALWPKAGFASLPSSATEANGLHIMCPDGVVWATLLVYTPRP